MIGLLRRYLRPYRLILAAVVLCQLLSTLAALYLPSLNADIVDRGIAQGDVDVILSAGGWMVLCTVAQAFAAVGSVYYGARVSASFGRDIRAAVFRHVVALPAQVVVRFGVSSLVNRTAHDALHTQRLVHSLAMVLVPAPVMGAGGIVLAVCQDVALSG
ncbi:ABC transporter transmembrane domain-containing protein [Phytoactinopolyspora halotolerans]|uniref:ABC transporter ATP-binding protein n=1 Tax=Phytoactinopolyspora halotolerans TaxID=1981512 RepID=A0A6L9S469_9ACTN|nr:ABC transporter transmembrane domain-containing protein [Phytoactinopolyspora halotolerans]NED99856.1 ABC transporter ATP-binding protein [Phytoactinopolyspora halotolerans]